MKRHPLSSMLEEFQKDTDWLDKNYDELKKNYPEEYVAVYKEKVVDHDSDLDKLLARLEKKYPENGGKIAIDYVTTEEIELVLSKNEDIVTLTDVS